MAYKSSIPQLTTKDTSSNLASVSDFGNLSNPIPNEEAPFPGRRIQLFPKNGFSSDNTSRSLVKSTSLYKRTLACGNLNIKIGEFIDVKLKDIQNKKGLDRANAILDLGRNGVLLEGQELDDETVDSIISVLFSLLDDPSWEVRMDALWLIDVLREEGYLDDFDFVEFEKELTSRNKSKENDPRVIENARKLSSNLRLQKASLFHNEKILSENVDLKDQLRQTKEINNRLMKENDSLLEKNNAYVRDSHRNLDLMNRLDNESAELDEELEEGEKRYKELNEAYRRLKNERDSLLEKNRQFKEADIIQVNFMNELDLESEEIEKELMHANVKLDQFRSQIQTLNIHLVEANKKLTEESAANAMLIQQMKKDKKSQEALELELSNQRKVNEDLRREVKTLRTPRVRKENEKPSLPKANLLNSSENLRVLGSKQQPNEPSVTPKIFGDLSNILGGA